MTTTDVEKRANREGLAGADFELQHTLRLDIFPQFLRDVLEIVGTPYWLWKTLSLTFNTSTRDCDLPADWKRFAELRIQLSTGGMAAGPMTYIGEHPDKIIAAENATTAGCPTQYYVVQSSTAGLWAVRLAAPSDASYTARGVYFWRIPFDEADPSEDIDLNEYMPTDVQYGLVHALRVRILEDRVGMEDHRYSRAEKAYARWMESLYIEPAAAPAGSRPVYAR